MKTNINCVVFTFPTICPTCEQEEHDNESTDEYADQELTLQDVLVSGTPLCVICDNELQPNDDCEILA